MAGTQQSLLLQHNTLLLLPLYRRPLCQLLSTINSTIIGVEGRQLRDAPGAM